MYGIKVNAKDCTYETFEGTRAELEEKDCIVFHEDEKALKSYISRIEYFLTYHQYCKLTIEQLQTKSDEILKMEQKLFIMMDDYKPGRYIDKRIEELEKNAQS